MSDPQTPPTRRAAHPWWTLIAALAFAAAALVAVPLTGVTILDVVDNVRGEVTWTTLFAGVFLTGAFIWWLLLARARRFTLIRGATAGVLVAFLSYPVVLVLADIFQQGWREHYDIFSYQSRTGNVLVRIAVTLLTTGFAATLIFALVGVALVWLLHRRSPDARPERGRGFWHSIPRLAGTFALLIVLFLVASFTLLTLMPLNTAGLLGPTTAATPQTHEQALAGFAAVQAREAELPLNPRCLSQLLTHGQKAKRVVVFFHGLTNCPAQAEKLGPQLFALGYNVYVPRMPQHGEADQMSLALADLTAEQLVAEANETMEIARGLGDEVVITGLSAGGIISSWIAHNRADANQSISMAPFFGPNVVPTWANRAATNLLLLLPNTMVWWDPKTRDNPPGMTYAYPRFATHGLAQAMRLGAAVMEAGAKNAPLGAGIAMLLNEADDAVSNPLAEQLIADWRKHGAEVNIEKLPLRLGLGHDLIDPHQPTGDPALVYQVLIDMMNGITPAVPPAGE